MLRAWAACLCSAPLCWPACTAAIACGWQRSGHRTHARRALPPTLPHPCAPLLPLLRTKVCPLAVPRYCVFRAGGDEDRYLRQLGYRISTDEDTGQVGAWAGLGGAGRASILAIAASGARAASTRLPQPSSPTISAPGSQP